MAVVIQNVFFIHDSILITQMWIHECEWLVRPEYCVKVMNNKADLFTFFFCRLREIVSTAKAIKTPAATLARKIPTAPPIMAPRLLTESVLAESSSSSESSVFLVGPSVVVGPSFLRALECIVSVLLAFLPCSNTQR